MSTAAIIAGTVAAGVGSAAIGAHAAGSAADAQVSAATHAADLQHEDAQAALDFNKQQYNTGQANLAPYLKNGYSSLSNLQYLMGTMNPSSAPGSQNGPTGPTSPTAFPPTGTQSMLRSGTAGQEGITATPAVLAAGAGPQPAPSVNGFDPIQADNNSDLPADRAFDGGMQMARSSGVSLDNPSSLPLDNSAGPATPDVQLPAPNTSLGAAGSLLAPFGETFKAPDAITEQNDPGFQARLNLGTTAMDNSAAARGRVLSGGATKDLNQFAQDYASNEYGNVYSRAFNDYATRYNQFKQQQTDVYNKLAGQAGLGQTTASTMATFGQNTANTNANIDLTSGAQIGQDLNNAGAARGSGYIGGANAISGAIGGGTQNLMNLAFLSKLFGTPGTSGSFSVPGNDPFTGATGSINGT